jgi:dephospho-CoA kinase
MIIGITGTNGAGKGTVVQYLVDHKGFAHYSVRAYIAEEIKRRGLPLDRASMNLVGNEMRATHGVEYWDTLIFKDAEEKGDENFIIDSVRNLASAKKLKEKGALLWGVDADRKTRYERAVLRGSETDKVSFEEFCAQEDKEMAQTAEHDMNIFQILKMADVLLTNNGTQEELYAQVEEALKKLS